MGRGEVGRGEMGINLRLDSSDMLPGIQKGEETARSLKTQPLWLSQLVMIT